MRLFVANFPDEADETVLQTLFEEHGKVISVKIITDFQTGKRRGFAFVSMPIKYQAQRAMKRLDGVDFMGQELAVREARKNVEKNRRTGRDRRKRQNPKYKGQERRKGERRASDRRKGRHRGRESSR